MAQVITAYKSWVIDAERAVSPRQIQFMEFDYTGANTDTAFDLATTAGTFWNAVDDTDTGAAAEKLMYQIAKKAAYFNHLHGEMILDFVAGTSASGVAYTIASGTEPNLPDIAFASGSAPTDFKFVMSWVLNEDETGIETSGEA